MRMPRLSRKQIAGAMVAKMALSVAALVLLGAAPAGLPFTYTELAWVIGGIAFILLLAYIFSRGMKGGDGPKDDDPFIGGGN